ncbi:MAG: hypothetical protein IJI05_05780 [Erysipelotrichaceae bacterium]|nr:hypothetical protein [Erysipelotrichaceae bacterium]
MKRKFTVLLAVLLLLSGLTACKKEEEEPTVKEKVFETENFTVTLTDDFRESSAEGFDWCLENKDVAVLFSYATREMLNEMGYPAEYNLDDFTTDVIADDEVISQESHENYNLFDYYSKDSDGNNDFYFLVGVYGSDDKFLLVNFACDAGAKSEFEDQFRTWAGKVTIK